MLRVLLVIIAALTALPILAALPTPVLADSHTETVDLRVDGLT